MEEKALRELVEGILSFWDNQVVRIILYGSYANGTYTSESDVDVALLLQGALDKKRRTVVGIDCNTQFEIR